MTSLLSSCVLEARGVFYRHEPKMEDSNSRNSLLVDLLLPEDKRNNSLYRNFFVFCLSFSVTHATVVGVLVYAASELGPVLGGVSSGLLYVFYALAALFLSKSVLRWQGSKIALLIGLSGTLIYVTTFMLALAWPPAQWYLCVPGSAIGGLGAGILWTAQGSYYTKNAALYAAHQLLQQSTVNNRFAAQFAFIYLASETIATSFVTLMYIVFSSGQWELVAFITYTVLAWIATASCASIQNFTSNTSRLSLMRNIQREVLAVQTLIHTHSRFYLVIPYQLAFGLCSSYIVFYVNGVILPQAGKDGYIGVLSAFVTFTAAAIALPTAKLVERCGKYPVTITGACLFALSSLVVLLLPNHIIASWVIIIPLCAVYGMGRGIWENTNKAVIADIFGDDEEDCEVAFAAIYFFSGISAAAGFFVYPHIPRLLLAALTMFVSLVAAVRNYQLSLVSCSSNAEAVSTI